MHDRRSPSPIVRDVLPDIGPPDSPRRPLFLVFRGDPGKWGTKRMMERVGHMYGKTPESGAAVPVADENVRPFGKSRKNRYQEWPRSNLPQGMLQGRLFEVPLDWPGRVRQRAWQVACLTRVDAASRKRHGYKTPSCRAVRRSHRVRLYNTNLKGRGQVRLSVALQVDARD